MELRTERLVLRDFRLSDADRVAEYQSDRRYLEHRDPDAAAISAEALVELFCRWAAESPRTRYQLAITLEGRVIGTCGIRKNDASDDEAEFGCELDPEYWRGGLGREAGQAMLDFAFSVLHVRQLHAHTTPANVPAIALAKSLGFREVAEGVLVMP